MQVKCRQIQTADPTCSPPADYLHTYQQAINPSICLSATPKSDYLNLAIMGATSIGTIRVEWPILALEHHQGTMALVSMGNLPADRGVDCPGSVGRSIERQASQPIGNLNRRRVRRVRRRASYRHILYTHRNGRKLHTGRRNHGNGAGHQRISVRQDRKTAREVARRRPRGRPRAGQDR